MVGWEAPLSYEWLGHVYDCVIHPIVQDASWTATGCVLVATSQIANLVWAQRGTPIATVSTFAFCEQTLWFSPIFSLFFELSSSLHPQSFARSLPLCSVHAQITYIARTPSLSLSGQWTRSRCLDRPNARHQCCTINTYGAACHNLLKENQQGSSA